MLMKSLIKAVHDEDYHFVSYKQLRIAKVGNKQKKKQLILSFMKRDRRIHRIHPNQSCH